MKMIIVMDKICLVSIAVAAFYVGYRSGCRVTELKHSIGKSNH